MKMIHIIFFLIIFYFKWGEEFEDVEDGQKAAIGKGYNQDL